MNPIIEEFDTSEEFSFCQNYNNPNLEKNKRTVNKVSKSNFDLKTEQKKISKIKNEENLDSKKIIKKISNKTEKLSVSKKRKSQSSCEEEPKEKKPNINKKTFIWSNEEYLAENEKISEKTAKNVIKLFEDGNTVPFIARYRNHLTENLKPDKIRKIKATYEYIQQLHKKAEKLIQLISSKETLTSDLVEFIATAKTLEELEYVSSQFKEVKKRALSERAKELGLENPAKQILEGKKYVDFNSLVNPKNPELGNATKVKSGIQHIIADIISKNVEVRALLEKIYSSNKVLLTSKFKNVKNKNCKVHSKYHLYGDFSQTVNAIQPHQTLAINRGESENALSVKVVIPDFMWIPLEDFCRKKWPGFSKQYWKFFKETLDDAIKRLIKPLAIRRIRAKLNAEAEDEALHIFGSNLRQLLMACPYSGKVVMGIDPGFQNGCKVALVSHTGSYIAHDVFFLNQKREAKKKLKKLVLDHQCETIALGNGTACRETENLLSDFIQEKTFRPLCVSYIIVDEQGISLYSCSPIAGEEFPNMDPKIVSAISLARRLQNPLSELVKVEPKHLGVGMYQHDVKENKLISALDEIVSECVSFVGVDINTASIYLLKRVAGLNGTKAQEIINYRTQKGPFKSREDLKKVKGIKEKTFQQCAGFIRIIPSTARCSENSHHRTIFNPLDETSIHPESYEVVYRLMKRFNLDLNQLGTNKFIDEFCQKLNSVTVDELAKYCECSNLSVEFIIETLKKPKNFDIRTYSRGPIFRKGIQKLEEIVPGQILDGIVRNVVPFGAFVDVGVQCNGLIHNSQMGNHNLRLFDKVKVLVLSKDLPNQKIELKLLSVIK